MIMTPYGDQNSTNTLSSFGPLVSAIVFKKFNARIDVSLHAEN